MGKVDNCKCFFPRTNVAPWPAPIRRSPFRCDAPLRTRTRLLPERLLGAGTGYRFLLNGQAGHDMNGWSFGDMTTRVLSDGELERIARHFRLLGEPMRLKILQAICKQPRTVSDIVTATGSTQTNVSKHLALLTAGGILKRERDGQCVYYGVKDQLVLRLCELVHAQMVG